MEKGGACLFLHRPSLNTTCHDGPTTKFSVKLYKGEDTYFNAGYVISFVIRCSADALLQDGPFLVEICMFYMTMGNQGFFSQDIKFEPLSFYHEFT